jgi:hypothetical protein
MEVMVLNELFGSYIATWAKRVTKRQLQLIAAGTKVQDVHVVPTEVELLPVEPGDSGQRIRIVGETLRCENLLQTQGWRPGKYEALTEAQVNTVLNLT